jgi:hypothetical protein
MRRSNIILASGLTVVAAAVICIEFLWPDEGLPQSQTLPDGSVLKVEAVAFGTKLVYHEVPPKAWQLAIGQRLPYALAARVGWRFNTRDWSQIGMQDGMTGLGLFTAREGLGQPTTDAIRVIVLDEHSNSLRLYDRGRSRLNLDNAGLHYHELQSWLFLAYPRRSKTFVVRFLREDGTGKADELVMQFHIANPHPGLYPTWTPEPWPATKNAGDLAVTLTDFTTGLSAIQPTRAAVENEMAVTRLGLELQQNGRTNCPWQVKMIEVSDATGNRWNALGPQLEGKRTMRLSGNLGTDESAWKLRVELAPTADISPDELVTFAGILVPPAGSNSPLALATNMDGFALRFKNIKTEKPGGKVKPPTMSVSISFETEGMPEDCRLSLVKVSDEHGNKVPINGSGELHWMESFNLSVPTNTASLNCTFGVRKSRFVEFIAKPRTP